jgi:flavin-dependent dehydrogenase
MDAEIYDVAIIGGGPAGSTAATLLAKAGRRVIVFEREKFPRFHIGESLLPASMRTFTRLGVQEKLRANFMEKFGGEMCSACSDEGVRFYFEDGYRSQCDRSYQVTRADFDKVLLDHAAENGVEVHEETAVERVKFTDENVVVTWRDARRRVPGLAGHDGACPSREIRARYLIDASGRTSVIGAMFGLRKNYEQLHKFSLFAHYAGVERPAGRDGTLTRMIRGVDRWFWVIPLTAERTSVGIVLDTANFREARQNPEKFFEEALAEQSVLTQTMLDAKRVSPVYSATDFSYRHTRLAGDRWLLAGDAGGFIDPVFSSGVFLAVMSGEMSADALDQALSKPKWAPRLFARYEHQFNYAMDVYVRFVNAWYKKEFIEVFLNPQDLLQIPPAVNALLGGNVFSGFGVRWRMWVFYLLVFLQKYFPLSPRRTLLPKQIEAAEAVEALS